VGRIALRCRLVNGNTSSPSLRPQIALERLGLGVARDWEAGKACEAAMSRETRAAAEVRGWLVIHSARVLRRVLSMAVVQC